MKKISVVTVLVLVTLLATGCQSKISEGSVEGNEKEFTISVTNTTKTYETQIEKDTDILVTIKKESGNMAVTIVSSDGAEVYRSDNASSWSFSVTTSKKDTYKFTVTGNDGKGSVSFKVGK